MAVSWHQEVVLVFQFHDLKVFMPICSESNFNEEDLLPCFVLKWFRSLSSVSWQFAFQSPFAYILLFPVNIWGPHTEGMPCLTSKFRNLVRSNWAEESWYWGARTHCMSPCRWYRLRCFCRWTRKPTLPAWTRNVEAALAKLQVTIWFITPSITLQV